jgi:hypothetical protein
MFELGEPMTVPMTVHMTVRMTVHMTVNVASTKARALHKGLSKHEPTEGHSQALVTHAGHLHYFAELAELRG